MECRTFRLKIDRDRLICEKVMWVGAYEDERTEGVRGRGEGLNGWVEEDLGEEHVIVGENEKYVAEALQGFVPARRGRPKMKEHNARVRQKYVVRRVESRSST